MPPLANSSRVVSWRAGGDGTRPSPATSVGESAEASLLGVEGGWRSGHPPQFWCGDAVGGSRETVRTPQLLLGRRTLAAGNLHFARACRRCYQVRTFFVVMCSGCVRSRM